MKKITGNVCDIELTCNYSQKNNKIKFTNMKTIDDDGNEAYIGFDFSIIDDEIMISNAKLPKNANTMPLPVEFFVRIDQFIRENEKAHKDVK